MSPRKAQQSNPQTRIINRGNGHSYLLDGEKAPGVTTITGGGIPKPWLAPWASRTVAEYVMDRLTEKDGHLFADELIADLRAYNDRATYPKKIDEDRFSRGAFSEVLKGVHYGERDAAANRGTQVHNLADALARGEEVDVPEEVAGHVDSYLQFLAESGLSDALLERVVVNRTRGYMGRLDIIGTLPWTPVLDESTGLWMVHRDEPSTALLDVKTNRKSPYDETGLQLAGYRFAETMLTEDGLDEIPMPQVDWCGVVWVRADGYDIFPYKADASVFAAFLHVKKVAEYFADDGPASKLKGPALSTPKVEVPA